MVTPVIQVQKLSKSFGDNSVLRHVSMDVATGETVVIIGASGSGKTSLLNVLGGLDELDAGTVKIAGQDLSQMSEKARTQVRNKDIGFV